MENKHAGAKARLVARILANIDEILNFKLIAKTAGPKEIATAPQSNDTPRMTAK